MRVRVVAFARLREILGEFYTLESPDGSTAGELWTALAAGHPRLVPFAGSTRLARNGRMLSDRSEVMQDGDELALLPPVGGG